MWEVSRKEMEREREESLHDYSSFLSKHHVHFSGTLHKWCCYGIGFDFGYWEKEAEGRDAGGERFDDIGTQNGVSDHRLHDSHWSVLFPV